MIDFLVENMASISQTYLKAADEYDRLSHILNNQRDELWAKYAELGDRLAIYNATHDGSKPLVLEGNSIGILYEQTKILKQEYDRTFEAHGKAFHVKISAFVAAL
jgi:hypothetical protein